MKKRSTEDFYQDMLKFRDKKERKLEEMRRKKDQDEISECK